MRGASFFLFWFKEWEKSTPILWLGHDCRGNKLSFIRRVSTSASSSRSYFKWDNIRLLKQELEGTFLPFPPIRDDRCGTLSLVFPPNLGSKPIHQITAGAKGKVITIWLTDVTRTVCTQDPNSRLILSRHLPPKRADSCIPPVWCDEKLRHVINEDSLQFLFVVHNVCDSVMANWANCQRQWNGSLISHHDAHGLYHQYLRPVIILSEQGRLYPTSFSFAKHS